MKPGACIWQYRNWQETGVQRCYEILRLRVAVFVVEQQCPYQEIDGLDPAALHVTAQDHKGQIMAYARILAPGVAFEETALGRILVIRKMRGKGLGRALIKNSIAHAQRKFPGYSLAISAQQQLSSYYASMGFIPVGLPYDDCGIRHVKMLYRGGRQLPVDE